ncbi:hypothetical protein CDAR_487402 [Caerostris darwini]|uniref:VWFA domain-containing protein n=1 Tax=Caerostris darwini TaxID=1538125 RepID=A0AAV4SA23_9ARAC|nr:hypothetical protein CDAR_487402 [Caerostris darwini]
MQQLALNMTKVPKSKSIEFNKVLSSKVDFPWYLSTSWAKEGQDKNDLYDCCTLSWYVQATASAKNIVILVDSSGSMTGIRKEIARNVVTDIVSTLTEDDFVTVLSYNRSGLGNSV